MIVPPTAQACCGSRVHPPGPARLVVLQRSRRPSRRPWLNAPGGALGCSPSKATLETVNSTLAGVQPSLISPSQSSSSWLSHWQVARVLDAADRP